MPSSTSAMRDEDAILTAPDRQRAQRAARRANWFGATIGFIVGGQLMQLYANDVLHWDAKRIAVLLALSPLVILLRYPLLGVIQRLGRVRMLEITALVRLAVVLVLVALPAAWTPAPLFIGLILVFQAALQLGPGVVWQPLLRDITTTHERGAFFAMMRFQFTLITVLATAGAAALVGGSMSEWVYKAFLAAAALMLLHHLRWVRRLPDPAVPVLEQGSWRRLREVLSTSQLLRRPLVVCLLMQAAALPILVIYLRQVLAVPASLVSLLILAQTIGTALGFLIWGKLCDAIGFQPMLLGLRILGVAVAPVLLLVPPMGGLGTGDPAFWIGGGALLTWGFLTGAVESGAGIATTALQHHLVDRRDAMEALAVLALAGALLGAALGGISGWWVQDLALPAGSWTVAGFIHLDWGKVWLCGLGPALLLIAGWLSRSLPNARSGTDVGDFFAGLTQHPVRSLVERQNLYSEDESERLELARLLGRWPNPLNLDPLLVLADDPSFDVRVEAIRALARSDSRRVAEALHERLNDPQDRAIWEHVAWALGELRHAPARARLEELVQSCDLPTVRAMAARALGKIGDPASVAVLVAALDREAVDQVHAAAGRALLRLGATSHAEALFQALGRQQIRHERYELMSVLCEWLGLSYRWLLRADSRQTPYAMLDRHLSWRPAEWLAERAAIVAAFQARDLATIQRHTAAALANGSAGPVAEAMGRVLRTITAWGPIANLATYWLLHRGDGPTARD